MKKVIFDNDVSNEIYFKDVKSENIIAVHYFEEIYILEETIEDFSYVWNNMLSGVNGEYLDDEVFDIIEDALNYVSDEDVNIFDNQIEFLEWCLKVEKNE